MCFSRCRPARAPVAAVFAWAALAGGGAAQDLAPDALFSQVAGSVYIVLATDGADLRTLLANPTVPPPEARTEGGGPAMTPARERALRAIGRTQSPSTASGLELGSAVALSKDIAVTNCHVVANHSMVAVVEGNKGVLAQVVHSQPNDICLLRVSGLELNPVRAMRMSSEVRVGERVYAIGNPGGLERTLSDGLVSGVRQRGNVRIVQTTAPISPGSSGGALFDARGNLIGITTFKSRLDPQLNFAVAVEEFWPLPASVAAGAAPPPQAATANPPPQAATAAPPPQAATATPPPQAATATTPQVAAAPAPPLRLDANSVTRCGPIEVRGIPFQKAGYQCAEGKPRNAPADSVEAMRLVGLFSGGSLEIDHARITSERHWSPISAAALKTSVERWAKAFNPSNLSAFEPGPFPHYRLTVVLNGRPFACARGYARGGRQDKVIVWITYCEPGALGPSPENLATVFGALRFE